MSRRIAISKANIVMTKFSFRQTLPAWAIYWILALLYITAAQAFTDIRHAYPRT